MPHELQGEHTPSPSPHQSSKAGKDTSQRVQPGCRSDRAMAMHTATLANSKLILPLALISTWLEDNTSLN